MKIKDADKFSNDDTANIPHHLLSAFTYFTFFLAKDDIYTQIAD